MILDHYGNPIPTVRGFRPTTKELAPGAGRYRDSTFLYDENPDEILQQQGFEAFDVVGRDPHVYGIFGIRRLSVAGRPRSIEPYSDKLKDRKQADFIRWCFDERLGYLGNTPKSVLSTDMSSWDASVYNLTKAYKNGFAILEVMWQQDNTGPYAGRWVVDKLKERDPDRFFFRDNEIYLKDSPLSRYGVKQPPFKFLHYAFDPEYNNPYGDALTNKIYHFQKFKRHVITYWITYMAKFGSPAVVGKYDHTLSKADRDQARTLLNAAIQAFQQEIGVSIPDNLLLELMEPKGNATDIYLQFCDWIDRQMTKAVLGNELNTGSEGVGSFGLAKATTQVSRQEQLEKDCKDIDLVLNRLIEWIVFLDYAGNVERCPHHTTHTAPEVDLTAKLEREVKLIEVGMPVPVSYARDTYNIPEPKADEEILQTPQLTMPEEPEEPDDQGEPHEPFAEKKNGFPVVPPVNPIDDAPEDIPDELKDQRIQRDGRKYLRGQKVLLRKDFDKLSPREKMTAFTITGIRDLNVINELHTALILTLSLPNEKAAWDRYVQDARKIFEKHDMTGGYPLADLFVSFRNGRQSAMVAGILRKAEKLNTQGKLFGLLYRTREDARVRNNHQYFNDILLPFDHRFWEIYLPINGHNCRCLPLIISRDMAKAGGLAYTPEAEIPWHITPDEGFWVET